MEAYQWFLLGIMVTWTPSLVVLALMLRGSIRSDAFDPNQRVSMSACAPLLGISGPCPGIAERSRRCKRMGVRASVNIHGVSL